MSLAKKYYLPLSGLIKGLVTTDQYPEVSVSGLSIDSRTIKAGDCFVALKGTVTDGAHYIQQAVLDGAVAVLVDDATEVLIDAVEVAVPILRVKNLSALVSEIAGRFYGNPSQNLTIVAFTGTNGKTTCSRLYAQLLAKITLFGDHCKSAYIGTTGYGIAESQSSDCLAGVFKNNQIDAVQLTTPDAVSAQRILAELLNNGSQHVALEASSHSLVQHRLKALQIDTAVFTNLSRDHLDYHQNLDSYTAAKASLFEMPSVKTAIINLDDPTGVQISAGLRPDINLVTFSLENQAAAIYCSNICLTASGVTATIMTPWGSGQLNSALLGQFNLSNLLAVIATACSRGALLEDCLQVIPQLEAVPGRMELVSSDIQPQVVVDYAHTPDALEKALQALKPYCMGKLWVIFGCGGNRDTGKRSEMGKIADHYADKVVITDDNPRHEASQQIAEQILQGVEGEACVELDRRQAIVTSILQADKQDVVLIAGKGHEDYQIIGNSTKPFSDQKEALVALEAAALNRAQSTEGGV